MAWMGGREQRIHAPTGPHRIRPRKNEPESERGGGMEGGREGGREGGKRGEERGEERERARVAMVKTGRSLICTNIRVEVIVAFDRLQPQRFLHLTQCHGCRRQAHHQRRRRIRRETRCDPAVQTETQCKVISSNKIHQ